MTLAWRELVRRPRRFAVAAGALTLLVVLLLLLGGLLDGVFLGSTGAIRSQDADVIVYSDTSRDSFLRSRITPEVRATVEGVDGVAVTGGLGVALLGANERGEPDDTVDVAVIGYERPPEGVPDPPAPGLAYADRRLEADDVAEGDVLLVGPADVPVEVAGFVSDTSYLLQGALWVEPSTWRGIQTSARPDAAVAPGVFQALVVEAEPGVGGAELAAAIDRVTGATSSLTKEDAVLSLPGTREQQSVFTALIGVTLFVAGLVSALFFVLLTLERTTLYATLKAIGAPSRRLLAGVVLQAVLVVAGAVVAGTLVTVLLARLIPREVPVQLEPTRMVVSGALVVVTSALGGLVTVRRIVRIDPATAIG